MLRQKSCSGSSPSSYGASLFACSDQYCLAFNHCSLPLPFWVSCLGLVLIHPTLLFWSHVHTKKLCLAYTFGCSWPSKTFSEVELSHKVQKTLLQELIRAADFIQPGFIESRELAGKAVCLQIEEGGLASTRVLRNMFSHASPLNK